MHPEMDSSSPREFDVVILGASGFSGRYVVAEALKFLSSPNSPLKTLALAGRNPTKISQALAWASAPQPPPPSIPIIPADVSSPSSLLDLAKRAKVLLNCVGPFCIYGAPVVSACVRAGTDYLDISGEPEFVDAMEADNHERAAKAGSLVVSACGFDTVVAELGFAFSSRQWVGPASAPNSVEAYTVQESDKRIVYATLETEVVMMENAAKPQPQHSRRRPTTRPPLAIPGPAPEGCVVEHQKSLGLWAVQRPAADATFVRRTLEALAENPEGLPGVEESDEDAKKRGDYWASVKPAHFGVKMGFKSPFGVLRLMVMGLFLWLLGMCSVGRSLLLRFPEFFSLGWFSRTGPTEEEVRSVTFKMWFVGRGYGGEAGQGRGKPDTEIVTRVSGPGAGYVTTAIILVQCALTVLSQRRNLPRGGVFTPGIVFGPTDLQERLQANGLSFEVMSKKTLADP